ncbi:MAG: hypothetical protein ACP5P3_02935 [Ignavibacteria bacterium]
MRYILLFIALLTISNLSFSQFTITDSTSGSITDSKQITRRPWEIRTYDYAFEQKPISYFLLGYLTTSIKYPERFNLDRLLQHGMTIGSRYYLHNIDSISTGFFGGFVLNVGGEFTLGIAGSTDKLSYSDLGVNYTYSTKHYTVVADLFSLNVTAEYFTSLPGNRGLSGGISLTFFNLGGTFTYIDDGPYKGKTFGIINPLPMYIQPYARLHFKGGILGIGLFLNPYSFAEYRFGPEGFFESSEEGFHMNSTQIGKYAIQIFLRF